MNGATRGQSNCEAVKERGAARVAWTRSRMPLMREVRGEFGRTMPFKGHWIGVSLHIEPKTAVLLEVLQAGGAGIVGTGNFGTTQDDVVAYLRSLGMTVYGRREDTHDAHQGNVGNVMRSGPDILLDNGADLAAEAVRRGTVDGILGGTEETTSGGNRLRNELKSVITFPSIVINDSPLKAIGENKHAVGESVVESFMRITNFMVNARRFVVVGYGWCSRGIAQYFRAFGGKVAIVEIDEIKALEACFDGYRVGRMEDFLEWGEVFVTATGEDRVITADHVNMMSDGAVLMNAGHFPWEIEVGKLREMAIGSTPIDDAMDRIDLPNGRHVVLIANGRMMNLSGHAPRGNSIASMDLGFALQALSLERIVEGRGLAGGAQPVPDDINRRVCRMFMEAAGSAA
ncbi:MAG: adenosylhomocysteinase [Proteobacteria bacterium]|nr:adenosylhomocysteinase [Pseudomonadota bacterium]